MATTEHFYTGNNSTTSFAFTFPYLSNSDVIVELDNVVKTENSSGQTNNDYTINNTNIVFNSAPGTGEAIHIYRTTNVDTAQAQYAAGSSIRAVDLNNNQTQVLYAAQEAGQLIRQSDLKDSVVNSAKIVDGSIATGDLADSLITTAKINADAVTGAKIANDQINSEHYVDASIDTQHIADSQITTAKIANSNVTTAKIADSNVTTAKIAADAITGAKIADDQINSEHYVDGSIDTAHIANSQITSAKIADGTIIAGDLASNSVTTAKITDANVTTAKIADSNVTTAKIAADAVTNAKIADNSIDSEHYVDGSIDTAHIADSQITTAKIADGSIATTKIPNSAVTTPKIHDDAVTTAKIANSNITTAKIAADAVTNAKIADDSIDSEHYVDGSIDTAHIAGAQVTDAKLASNSVTTSKITDANVTTVKVADANITLAKLASDLKQTTISNSDTQLPTSGAVVDYVAAQIAPLGGLEVIATEVAFPNTQPSSGVVISISDAAGVAVNGSGTSTTGRTVGGSTVTINNFPSSLNNETLATGVGLMVSSTGSSQTYNYHKILAAETDVKQLSDDINDFNARYRVGSSNPTSALDSGDLFFNTGTGKLLVYNGTASAWEEAQSIGQYFINTISSYSGTGGNSASFNGSAYRFVLSNAGATAEQHIVSVNGVVQKPNSGTSQPSEGFAVDGSSIIFSSAPPSGSDFFIITIGSTVNIGTPSNGTVTTDKLASSAVTTVKLADDAVSAAKIGTLTADVDFNDNVKARFGTGNDLEIFHTGAYSTLKTNNTDLLLGASEVGIRPASLTEHCGRFISNGAVELYYDNSKKFETVSGGINVTGSVTDDGANHDGDVNFYGVSSYNAQWDKSDASLKLLDNAKLKIGTGADLQIYHDGSHSYIEDAGTGKLRLKTGGFLVQTTTDETMIQALQNNQVELYYDNSKKFETTSTGATVTGSIVTDHPLSNRNMLLNGSMRVAQRLAGNDGGSYTLSGGDYRGVDLSMVRTSNSSQLTIEQPTHGSLQELGLYNSLKITTATANSSFSSTAYTTAVLHLEGAHIGPTNWGKSTAQTCTLSFYVRSNVTGTFSGSFGNASNNRSNAFEYTINNTETWERKTITVTGDTTGTWSKDHNLGAKITFSLGHGSNFNGTAGSWTASEVMGTSNQTNFCSATGKYWEISGVQFELGSVATPIENQDFSPTLQKCRRYFYRTKSYGSSLNAVDAWNTAEGTLNQSKHGANYDTHYFWPVEMRSNPTITFYGSDGTVNKNRFEQIGVTNTEFVVPINTLTSRTTGFFVRHSVNSGHTGNSAFYTGTGNCFVRLTLDASSEF